MRRGLPFAAALVVVAAATTLLALLDASAPSATPSVTFTVNTTADTDDFDCNVVCSLRDAANLAASNAVPDTITFDIPPQDPGCDMDGVCTIELTMGPLLLASDPGGGTLIDGYTQDGASPNTAPFGQPVDADIKIAVDGGGTVGYMRIASPDNLVRGVAIYGFTASGLEIADGAHNSRIEGNFIGTSAEGLAAPAGGAAQPASGTTGNLVGVLVTSLNTDPPTGVVIGGPDPEHRNVISNNAAGVEVAVTGDTLIEGNYIGTDYTGVNPLGNGLRGVRFFTGAHDNIVKRNLIAFNSQGVAIQSVTDADHNTFTENSIHSNTNQGISLGGHNEGIGPPAIDGFGSVFGVACENCTIEVFSDDDDEGRTYEGTAVANGDGDWNLNVDPVGPNVTATATDANGNTSAFSEPVSLSNGTPTPTPSPTATPTPTPTSTVTPVGQTPTPTPTPTPVGQTPTPTPTPTPVGQTPTPTPTPTATPEPGALTQGDNDCDGDSDAVDALVSLQKNAGIDPNQQLGCPELGGAIPAGGDPQLFGDIDCDGDSDAVDALQILRNVAGLPVNQNDGCPAIGDPL